jgi:hypothetical protein
MGDVKSAANVGERRAIAAVMFTTAPTVPNNQHFTWLDATQVKSASLAVPQQAENGAL